MFSFYEKTNVKKGRLIYPRKKSYDRSFHIEINRANTPPIVSI